MDCKPVVDAEDCVQIHANKAEVLKLYDLSFDNDCHSLSSVTVTVSLSVSGKFFTFSDNDNINRG